MVRIKMYISKAKLSFNPPCEVKCRLQNRVSTYTTIKTPKTLTNQGTCNILRRVFGRFHTGTLCKVFFVFVSRVLSKTREDCVVHWQFLASSGYNLNSQLKLLFCSSITINNNLPLKIYCENIVCIAFLIINTNK